MVERFFRGDKVRTKIGVGIVQDVVTWRDVIIEMSEYEANDFCARCKTDVGVNFREDWVQLLVKIGGRYEKVQAITVKLLEGRDGVEEGSLGQAVIKKSVCDD
jgi:hypothetical protein